MHVERLAMDGPALALVDVMVRANIVLICLAFVTTALPAFAKKPAPPAPEPSGPAFDKQAAATTLGSVSVLPCKQTKGPTGEGHVIVTFAPTGEAQEAIVDRDPFKNTAVGRCVAMQYKHARVPKFAGPPVTVGKTFRLD
jgi:hypothetical protein